MVKLTIIIKYNQTLSLKQIQAHMTLNIIMSRIKASITYKDTNIILDTKTPSTTEATTLADNQLDVMPSLHQNVDQGVAQQPVSTITQASRDQRRDDQIASQIPTIEEQPSPAATYHQSMILSLVT